MVYGHTNFDETSCCNSPDAPMREEKIKSPNLREMLTDTEKELMEILSLVESINILLLGERDTKGDSKIEVNSMNTNVISNMWLAQEIRRKLNLTASTLGV